MGWYGLSDSEHEIMKYIWKHEEVTLREVVAWLENRGYTWKQQTVYTLLNRLIDKEAITAIKKGNYRLYYPAITEDELIGQWTENSSARNLSSFFGDVFSQDKENKRWRTVGTPSEI